MFLFSFFFFLLIPAGIPTTEAYEAILKVPNDADKVMNILSK